MMESVPSPPSLRLQLNGSIYSSNNNHSSNNNNNSSRGWMGALEGDWPRSNQSASLHEHIHSATLGVFLGLLSLLTIVMNLLVLYAVKREKSLHTVGNLYIVSLSVADLIVGATVMPLNLIYLLDGKWKLGRAVCQFWLIMDYVASTASIFSLFILCLDRYRSVRQPLKYLKYRTRGKASLMICGAWLLSVMWIIPILGWRSFTHVDRKPEDENMCDTDFRFITWFKVVTAVFNFYVPSVLMLWFYTHIYLAVRQHLRDRERIIHPTDSFGENENENEQNAPTSEKKRASETKGDGEVSAKHSQKQHFLDHNTLQTYSLEDANKSKIAPCRLETDKRQQRSLLAMTTKRLRMAKAKRRSLSPQKSPADSESAVSQPSLPQDMVCPERTAADKVQRQGPAPDGVTGVCDVSQVADVRRYASVPYNHYDLNSPVRWTEDGGDGGRLDPANAATIRQTWQKFIEQSRERIQSLRIHKEHKAAKQLGFIIAAFLLCWIPYFITFMVMAVCSECVHHDLHMFTIWLGYINSTLNPFIYPLCNGNFKRVFKNILHIPAHL